MTSKKNLTDDTKPGARFKDITDRTMDQIRYTSEFQYDIVDILDKLNEKDPDGIQFTIISSAIT